MVWGFGKRCLDLKCLPTKIPNYFQMFCSTFGPCRRICKPLTTITKETKDCKKCCAYCIKPNSCTKLEKVFLKNKRFDDVHYLRPGAMCVVNIEEKFLKSRKERKKLIRKYVTQ